MTKTTKRSSSSSSQKARIKRVFSAAEQSVARVYKESERAILKACELVEASDGLIITTGVGKSGFIAAKCAATLTSLGRRAFTLSPTDALHGDVGAVTDSDVVIAFSYSGETAELLKTIRHIKKETKAKVIAISGKATSSLAKLSNVTIATPVDSEGSTHDLAPMASTTVALVVADALASALVDPKDFTHHAFARLHPAGSLGLQLETVEKLMLRGSAVPAVGERASFKEALLELSKKRQGIVAVVTKGGTILGVLSDGDVRRAVIAGVDTSNIKITEVMTPHPKVIGKDATLKEALTEMERGKQVTSLFVVDGNEKLLGIIHMHHIIPTVLV